MSEITNRKRVRQDDNDKNEENGKQHVQSEHRDVEKEKVPSKSASTVHLDQIQRGCLDFDMEKVCSVTLWPRSVYCCLVCGKFFQGRAKGSHLYMHSIEAGHFVAMNLANGTIHSMPDGGAIEDSSLDDIKYNLKPVFTAEDMAFLATPVESVALQSPPLRDFHGKTYYPGIVGLNNFQATDYINSVVQALVRIRPIREHFLKRELWEESESRVTRSFGELVCQMFSMKKFKNTVSPNEFLHAVSSATGNKFQAGTRADAKDFLLWLLHELHKGSGGTRKPNSSFIHECFQGEVRVETTVFEIKRDFDDAYDENAQARMRLGPSRAGATEEQRSGPAVQTQLVSNKVERVPFMFLSLDLPTNPLFTDVLEGETTIPHTTLLEVLQKYDGVKAVDVTLPGGRLEQKRYLVTRLPRYLIFHLNRFNRTENFVEKNRSVVTLPLKNLDMKPFVETNAMSFQYNLVSTVCHNGGVGPGVRDAISEGRYKANVYYPPKDGWFEADDLAVKFVDMPQLVAVAETYLAFFERSA